MLTWILYALQKQPLAVWFPFCVILNCSRKAETIHLYLDNPRTPQRTAAPGQRHKPGQSPRHPGITTTLRHTRQGVASSLIAANAGSATKPHSCWMAMPSRFIFNILSKTFCQFWPIDLDVVLPSSNKQKQSPKQRDFCKESYKGISCRIENSPLCPTQQVWEVFRNSLMYIRKILSCTKINQSFDSIFHKLFQVLLSQKAYQCRHTWDSDFFWTVITETP